MKYLVLLKNLRSNTSKLALKKNRSKEMNKERGKDKLVIKINNKNRVPILCRVKFNIPSNMLSSIPSNRVMNFLHTDPILQSRYIHAASIETKSRYLLQIVLLKLLKLIHYSSSIRKCFTKIILYKNCL